MEKLNAASRKAFKEAEAAYEEELNAWTASKDLKIRAQNLKSPPEGSTT
jgi:hypothetical protein